MARAGTHMAAGDGGSIINISSIASLVRPTPSPTARQAVSMPSPNPSPGPSGQGAGTLLRPGPSHRYLQGLGYGGLLDRAASTIPLQRGGGPVVGGAAASAASSYHGYGARVGGSRTGRAAPPRGSDAAPGPRRRRWGAAASQPHLPTGRRSPRPGGGARRGGPGPHGGGVKHHDIRRRPAPADPVMMPSCAAAAWSSGHRFRQAEGSFLPNVLLDDLGEGPMAPGMEAVGLPSEEMDTGSRMKRRCKSSSMMK